VLGWLLERLTGERLDGLAHKQIAAPLALTATTFHEPVATRSARARAGERIDRGDAAVRGAQRVLIGEVDDLNAMAMGGIAGHAGCSRRRRSCRGSRRRCVAPGAGDDAGAGALVDRDVCATFWSPSGIAGFDLAARLGRAGGRNSQARDEVLARGAWATWASPAARCGSIPRARPDRHALSNRVHPAVPRTMLQALPPRCCTTRSPTRVKRSAPPATVVTDVDHRKLRKAGDVDGRSG
jgi:hypothetical protein